MAVEFESRLMTGGCFDDSRKEKKNLVFYSSSIKHFHSESYTYRFYSLERLTISSINDGRYKEETVMNLE